MVQFSFINFLYFQLPDLWFWYWGTMVIDRSLESATANWLPRESTAHKESFVINLSHNSILYSWSLKFISEIWWIYGSTWTFFGNFRVAFVLSFGVSEGSLPCAKRQNGNNVNDTIMNIFPIITRWIDLTIYMWCGNRGWWQINPCFETFKYCLNRKNNEDTSLIRQTNTSKGVIQEHWSITEYRCQQASPRGHFLFIADDLKDPDGTELVLPYAEDSGQHSFYLWKTNENTAHSRELRNDRTN